MQRERPAMQIIEPFERVEAVLNRATIQNLVQQMGSSNDDCTIPAAFLYQTPARSDAAPPLRSHAPAVLLPSSPALGNMPVLASLPLHTRFPVICKSVAACGSPDSHRMYLLQRPEDFASMHAHDCAHTAAKQAAAANNAIIAASSLAVPAALAGATDSSSSSSAADDAAAAADVAAPPVWLVQQYINHSAVIYKVYVLDEEVKVVAKVSARGNEQWQPGKARAERRGR
jgi:hypothetical protein